VSTIREYVIPNDPRTTDQLERRSIFSVAVGVARAVGSPIWQLPWNRSLGDLPGWQSFVGYCIKGIEKHDGDFRWTSPPNSKSLGPVYMPPMTASAEVPSSLELTWDKTLIGDHCALSDVLQGFITLQTAPDTPEKVQVISPGTAREDETYTFADLETSTPYFVCVWFRHAEESGAYTYSPCYVVIQTSGAAA